MTAWEPSLTSLHVPWLSAPVLPGRGLREWGWHAWLGTETGVVLVTALLLPAVVAAVCGVAWWRRRSGVPAAQAWRWAVCEVGVVYGTAPFVWMTMLPAGGRSHGAVSLVPLRDLATMSTFQVVGNLLVFAALGFLAPVRLGTRASVLRVTAVAAGCSTLIEVAQYVLPLNRVSSVDDVLLNTAGAAVAALASKALLRGAGLVRGRGRRHPVTAAVDG